MTTRTSGSPLVQQYLDVFLSHASEDRADVARPLARALIALGYSVWISDEDVVVGSALPFRINDGLRSCRFGVTILSPPYLQKYWTRKELAALTSREEVEARDIIIPVLWNIERVQLTREFPLWAPIVSVTWNGDAESMAHAVAKALGAPVKTPGANEQAAFAFAAAISRGELDLGPRQSELVKGAGEVVAAITSVWTIVQTSNKGFPRGASDARKRAHAMTLAASLATPSRAVHLRSQALKEAAEEYALTLRRLLEIAEATPTLDRRLLAGLNGVFSGVVAATFGQMAALFTDKRAQTVTFPKRHPNLTQALDRIGDDLGGVALAFELLVDFCIAELPARIQRILERLEKRD